MAQADIYTDAQGRRRVDRTGDHQAKPPEDQSKEIATLKADLAKVKADLQKARDDLDNFTICGLSGSGPDGISYEPPLATSAATVNQVICVKNEDGSFSKKIAHYVNGLLVTVTDP